MHQWPRPWPTPPSSGTWAAAPRASTGDQPPHTSQAGQGEPPPAPLDPIEDVGGGGGGDQRPPGQGSDRWQQGGTRECEGSQVAVLGMFPEPHSPGEQVFLEVGPPPTSPPPPRPATSPTRE